MNFWEGLLLGVVSMIVLESWLHLREIKRRERRTADIVEHFQCGKKVKS